MPCSRLQSDASGRATLSRSSKLNEVGFTISGLVELFECDLIDHGSNTQTEIRRRPNITGGRCRSQRRRHKWLTNILHA
jgi:hypothetical protein